MSLIALRPPDLRISVRPLTVINQIGLGEAVSSPPRGTFCVALRNPELEAQYVENGLPRYVGRYCKHCFILHSAPMNITDGSLRRSRSWLGAKGKK